MIIVGKNKEEIEPEEEQFHKYGIVVAARNEENVIGALIDSINKQNYPSELIQIYIVADNCSDQTASVAAKKGAIVYERNDRSRIGKGYALNFLFERALKESDCDAFIIFDADNVVSPDYVKEINKTFCRGYKAVLGYRNSKNYATNWISAGYSLWFLRDSEYLNHPRMNLGTSCLVAGTGFLISRQILEENGGWNYFSLTEDVEFSADMIIKGEKIGYCGKAMFFDEQPISFKQSWVQRVRWARGFYQNVWKSGSKLLKGAVLKRNFACFDLLMSIFPALLITLIYLVITIIKLLVNFAIAPSVNVLILGVLHLLPFMIFGYLVMYVAGLIPTITEWNQIEATSSQKILYTFTFPIFMFTFIPIAGEALFKRVEWQPVEHTIVKDIDDLMNRFKASVKE